LVTSAVSAWRCGPEGRVDLGAGGDGPAPWAGARVGGDDRLDLGGTALGGDPDGYLGGGRLAQAQRARGRDATAFAYRDGGWAGVIVGVDPDPASAGPISQWARDYWEALKRYDPDNTFHINQNIQPATQADVGA
jgi:hypothetical protein